MQTRPKTETSAAREAAFRRAQKHSRKVQFLKFVLPAAAILIAGSFAAYSYVSVPGSVSFDISESAYTRRQAGHGQSEARRLHQGKPPLFDDGDPRAFSIWTTAASSTSKASTPGCRSAPRSSRRSARRRGIYDREKNTLDIPSAITVKTTDGMTAMLQSAYLEIGQGNLSTKDPVDIKLDGAQIVADAMSGP